MKFYFKILAFLQEDKGLTTVEYAVAGSLIALAAIGAFTALGGTVGEVICDIQSEIGTASGSCIPG